MAMTKLEKENIINNYMKSLSIDREEAEELFLADYEDELTEEAQATVEELTQKEKALPKKQEARKKTTTDRKPKERKVDVTKGEMIKATAELLANMGANINNIKTETEISFTFRGEEYTFKLTKHRKPKDK